MLGGQGGGRGQKEGKRDLQKLLFLSRGHKCPPVPREGWRRRYAGCAVCLKLFSGRSAADGHGAASCRELRESAAELAAQVALKRWGQQTHKDVLGVDASETPCKVAFLNQMFVLLWPHSP